MDGMWGWSGIGAGRGADGMRKSKRDNGWAVRDKGNEEEMRDKGKEEEEGEYEMKGGRDGTENKEIINSRGRDQITKSQVTCPNPAFCPLSLCLCKAN